MAMGLSTKFYMECRVVMCVFVWPHLDAPKCSTEHHIIHWCRTPFWNRHSLTRNFSIILFSVQFLLVRKNSYRKRVRMLCCSRCATNEAIFWLHFGICVAISGLEKLFVLLLICYGRRNFFMKMKFIEFLFFLFVLSHATKTKARKY